MTTATDDRLDGVHARSIRMFDRHGHDVEVDPGAIAPSDLVRRAARERGLLWVDLADPDADVIAPWATALDLHPLAVDEAVTGDQQPTVQGFGDQLFLVFWAAPDRERAHPDVTPKLFVFLGDHFLLTVQRDATPRTYELDRRLPAEPDYLAGGAAGALYVILAAVVEHYGMLVNTIEQELSDLETAVFDEAVVDDAGRIYKLRQRLGRLERPVASLVHSLSRTPDSLTRLIRRDPALAPYLSDAIDDLMGIGGLVRDQRDSLDTIVSSHENNVAQRQNADMRRISAYGALLAVPTVIAGLYGMNFKDLPGTSWHWGWLAVLVAIIAIDAVITVIFKRRRWL